MLKKMLVTVTFFCCTAAVFAQTEIIYHVFQRSFFDSDGDGHGDLKGIQQKLDYLQELGVTSILLTPLCQSDFYHNYFGSDFEKIDPAYGSMAGYISLVKEVHKRKMKIYQDIEMQYVDGNHPWFTGSYNSPGSAFSRYVYYLDGQNQQPFWLMNIAEFSTYNNRKQKIAVVNMHTPAVRQYTADVLGFWVDPNKDGLFDDGVDGFRFDHMMDDLDYAGKLTHLFKDFWTPVIKSLKQKNPAVRMIAEQANWNSLGYEYFNEGQIDDVFAFRLKFAIESFNKQKITKAADSTFMAMPPGKQQIVFIENHDTKRFASVDNQSLPKLKIGAALNLLLGGTPSIYYGQELGMKGKQLKGFTDGNDIPIREAFEWYKTVEGKGMALWYKGTGVWWDSTNIKANDGISLEEERADPASLWNYYRKMIRLKKEHPAFAAGAYRTAENNNDQVFSFLRSAASEKALVVVNLSAQQQNVMVTTGVVRINSAVSLYGGSSNKPGNASLSLELQPYEVQVYKLE